MKRTGTKVIAAIILLFALILGGRQLYGILRFRAYRGYRRFLPADTVYEPDTGFHPSAGEGEFAGMALAAENGILRLYVDTATANIAVYDKRSGAVTWSVPPGVDDDPAANRVNISLLKSPVILEYYTGERLEGIYNSYDNSVSGGDLLIEGIENGLRVLYTFGRTGGTTGTVPVYISRERLDYFIGRLKDAGLDQEIRNIDRYQDSKTAEGFLELPESLRGGAGTMRRMNAAFEAAGYTKADYDADMAAAGSAEGNIIIVPLEYRLEDDRLEVSIPRKAIRELSAAKVHRIQLLRGFAAAGRDEEGYFLLPNGSGSLLYFNNGKTGADDYNQFIYGRDPLAASYTTFENAEPARLPLFGIEKRDAAILVSVERGAALADISASVGGKTSSYNTAFTSFTVRAAGSLAMFGVAGNEADLPVLSPELFDTDFTLHYYFLPPGYRGYSGMANYLREKYERAGLFNRITETGDIPLYIDMIGGVMGENFFLGRRYEDIIPMTTYAEAAAISGELESLGAARQVVNFQGWFNRGYYHDVADRIGLIKDLGGEKVLEQLTASIESRGGRLYGDTAFQLVTYVSKRYNWIWESAQYYSGVYAAWGGVDPVTFVNYYSFGHREINHHFLSPKFLPRYVSAFAARIGAYPLTGIALRDLGDVLHSDFRRSEIIDRQAAEDIIVSQLGILKNTGKKLLVTGGNFYALPFADDLTGVPLGANAQRILDLEVPFYQMLIHGYVDYAGPPENLSGSFNRVETVLNLLEFGASPRFTFSYRPSIDMRETGLNRLYSTSYKVWAGDAVEIYREVNAVLGKLRGAAITGHEVRGDLRIITYDNGMRLLVNRGDMREEYDGSFIGPRDYVLKEAGI